MQKTLQNVAHQVRDVRQDIQDWDAGRPGFTGEHWLVLATGIALFLVTRRTSMPMKLAGSILGGMLVVRAATGRDGLEQKRWLPI